MKMLWLGLQRVPDFAEGMCSGSGCSGCQTSPRACNLPKAYRALSGFMCKEMGQWVLRFVDWYNHTHRHSAIRYVTPVQRHNGDDAKLLANRRCVYAEAEARDPRRWSGQTRNRMPVGSVYRNSEDPARHLTCKKRSMRLRTTISGLTDVADVANRPVLA